MDGYGRIPPDGAELLLSFPSLSPLGVSVVLLCSFFTGVCVFNVCDSSNIDGWRDRSEGCLAWDWTLG